MKIDKLIMLRMILLGSPINGKNRPIDLFDFQFEHARRQWIQYAIEGS